STNQQYAPTWDPATGTLTASAISSTAEGAAVRGLGIDFTVQLKPSANDQTVVLDEDTPQAITLTGSPLDGEALTYTVLTQPTNGVLSGTVPSLTYTPAANYNGTDSFTFLVNNGLANSQTATVSIVVAPVDDAPVFVSTPLTLAAASKGAAYLQTLAGSVTDPEGTTITYRKISGPAWLSIATDGTLTGTPGALEGGLNSWTVQATDETGLSSTGTVQIAVNANPAADVVSITGIGPTKIGTNLVATLSTSGGLFTDRSPAFPLAGGDPVSTLDSDYYGVTVTNLSVGGVTNATLTFDLRLSLVTNATVKGLAIRTTSNYSFGYWIDSNGNSYSRFFDSGAVLTFSVTNVTIDKGFEVPTVSFRADQLWGLYLNSGVVSTNLQYTPTWNPATGTLTASSFSSGVEGAAVRGLGIDFTFSTVPVAAPQSVTAYCYRSNAVTLAATPESSAFTYTVLTQPAHGTLSGTAPNLFYTPSTNYSGADSFTFKASNGAVDSAPATVSITAQFVGYPPAFTNGTLTRGIALIGTNYTGQTLSGSAADPENSALTYRKVSGPAWLQIASDGALSGTPGIRDLGGNSWVVEVSDPTGLTGTATLSLTVRTTLFDVITMTGIEPTKTLTNLLATVSHSGQFFVDHRPTLSTNTTADYYGVTITNMVISGVSNVTMTFDLKLTTTPSALIGGWNVRSNSYTTFGHWVSCKPGLQNNFFDSGAVLTFAVTNVTIDQGFAIAATSFRADPPWGLYTNLATDVVSTNTRYAPTWDPATGTLTASTNYSSSEGAVVRGLGINFKVSLLPDYTAWAEAHNLSGEDAYLQANPDGDRFNNLVEYALGSNPTNAANAGNRPIIRVTPQGVEFIYRRRVDSLTRNRVNYTVQSTGSLMAPAWTNNFVETGSGTEADGMESVTNRAPGTGTTMFGRLLINYTE
ncbi:MAG TPA: tandem-95 repeat protein, partial [Pontiellaceae bacterium]|nr:tandem-95 repeat protein [Pontiellaceae bacterium]